MILKLDGYEIKHKKYYILIVIYSKFSVFILLLAAAKGAENLVNNEGGEEEECNNESSFQSWTNDNDTSRVEFCPGGGVQHTAGTPSQDARQAVAALNTDRIQATNNAATTPSHEDPEERNVLKFYLQNVLLARRLIDDPSFSKTLSVSLDHLYRDYCMQVFMLQEACFVAVIRLCNLQVCRFVKSLLIYSVNNCVI